MAQALYFLPDLRKQSCDGLLIRGVLKERGLTDIFADVPYESITLNELTGRGPGGKSGIIITYQTNDGTIPRRIGFYEKEQSWTPVGDGSLLWIGLDTAEPPKPEEMARKHQIRGYHTPLGGELPWIVPVIRRPNEGTLLPRAFIRDNAGRQVEQVRSAYQHYWDEYREAAEWMYGGMPAEKFSQAQAVDLAIKALAINYRFGWNEQNVLQLVDSENYLLILGAAVDLPAYDATTVQKKMNGHSTEPSSTPGQPGESEITSPVGAICS